MFRLVVAVVTLALLAPGLSSASGADTFETTLDNGMKLIVKEDRRAPSVVHMVWYGVGAMHEPDGKSGIAHMLEHMMFKGTEKIGPGEFSRRVSAMGGRDNAFTSRDTTGYFQQIPPRHLADVMALEADRMQHLIITDNEFLPEREVVKEERRLRVEDNPRALVFEQLMASAFQAHPYRRPVIGWMTDIEDYASEDARRWHEDWYAPNNAWMVVVGDVDHEEVFALAREHYGEVPERELAERHISREPEQRGIRHSTVRAPADLPFVALAWHVPTLRDADGDRDAYALKVLASVLDGYDGARLPRHIVREREMAVSVGAQYRGTGLGPSLFILTGAPAPGHSLPDLETALTEQIERIAEEGIGEDELQRVVTQTLASEVFKRDSLMGQAMEIGMLEAAGLSWRDEQALLEGIRSVTAEEVQDVAGRYFRDAVFSRAELEPVRSEEGEDGSAFTTHPTLQ